MKVAERTAELRRSEALLAEGQRLTHAGTWAFNPATGAIVALSEETYRLYGFDPKRGIPPFEEWAQRLHPDDRERIIKARERALREGTDYEMDFRTVLPDGAIRYIHAVDHPVFSASGDLVEFVGSAIDITERKRNEEALRQTEYYLAEGERLTHTGSYAWNAASGLVYTSAELLRVFGFDPEERTTPPMQHFVNGFIRTIWPCSTHSKIGSPCRFQRVGGGCGKHWYYPRCHRTQAGGGGPRETAPGRGRPRICEPGHKLTASLAHEIKQPLAAAVANAKTCLRWLTRDHPAVEEAREAASRLVKDVMRANDIIDRIWLLFKKGEPPRELVDVSEVVQELIVLLRSEASRYSISIRTDLAADLPKCTADRVQLQQIFMNLMLNGIDAMKDANPAGALTIKSQQIENGEL